jgi:hypothetical protein
VLGCGLRLCSAGVVMAGRGLPVCAGVVFLARRAGRPGGRGLRAVSGRLVLLPVDGAVRLAGLALRRGYGRGRLSAHGGKLGRPFDDQSSAGVSSGDLSDLP